MMIRNNAARVITDLGRHEAVQEKASMPFFRHHFWRSLEIGGVASCVGIVEL